MALTRPLLAWARRRRTVRLSSGAGGNVWSDTFSTEFDGGSTLYVAIPHDAAQNNATAFSVCAWVKATVINTQNPSANDTIMSKWDYNLDGGWAIQLYPTGTSNITVFIATSPTDNGSGCRVDTNTAAFTLNTWNHVAFTFAPNDVRIYLNGAQQTTVTAQGSIPAAMQTPTTEMRIGTWGGTLASRLWDGRMSQVSMWHATLSAADITAIYNSGSPVDEDALGISGLVGFWLMGDANGDFDTNEINDIKSGWNGTLQNGSIAQRSTDVP